jgi:hypothetical protein
MFFFGYAHVRSSGTFNGLPKGAGQLHAVSWTGDSAVVYLLTLIWLLRLLDCKLCSGCKTRPGFK